MPLNCHTYYSFGYGTLAIEELLNHMENMGYKEIVLSDINNTSAILDALRLKQESKFKIIPGIDFRNGIRQQYIGIARNNEGFQELNEHLSVHLHQKKDFGNIAPAFRNAYVIYPFKNYDPSRKLLEHEFIGINSRELLLLPFSSLKNFISKMVVLNPVSFIGKKHFNAHRLLRAIDTNTLLSKLPKSEEAPPDEMAMPKEELYNLFGAYPQIVENTKFILSESFVDFKFDKLDNKNRKHYTESIEGDIKKLSELAYQGLSYRYSDPSEEVLLRIEKELSIIKEKEFASYFLINWDITKYARDKGYFYVGRGSGANSIVAYLLRITDVDPIELDLYFERFINIHRANAPDFDIDFSWTDRDDITDYIFRTFGSDGKAALLGTYATYQHDAITRELGKVFGLTPSEIDKLQNLKKPEDTSDPMQKLILNYAGFLEGFPSHLSIHASGIIISEKPVTAYCATNLPPKGYPTTQFSMLEAEDIGLFKFDILSQRGLGKIKDAIEIIQKNKGHSIDIHAVQEFKKDEKIKDLLKVGKCIGCFYVESPAMRMLLAKLRADDYLRLVAASSIIRPGVSKSGMMNEYIVRYRKPEVAEKAQQELPQLYELLKETYGVMVYQEDVIKIAHLFAGLSLADADYLRRGMSWKFKQRNEFHRVKDKFFRNCQEKGHAYTTVDKIWTQIESFANFAFSKGHSASYAVESYQALYLKAHYPLEYMVATLNNGGGFYRTELYIHEARLHGAEIVPPCVNNSTEKSVIKGHVIYLGFEIIGQLEKTSIATIVLEREVNGAYSSLYNFIKRTGISIEQLRILIRAGALQFISKNKKELLWQAHMLINPIKPKSEGSELFDVEPQQYTLPALENTWQDDAYDELELFGFSLCSPFKLLKEPVKNTLQSADLKSRIGKTVEIIGYLVNIKTTYTSNGQKMYFGTFLDQDGLWIDTVHFPPAAAAYPFSGPGTYSIIGKVSEEFDFVSIDVSCLQRLAVISREDETGLRPFSRANKDRVYQGRR